MIPSWRAKVNAADRSKPLMLQNREQFVNYVIGSFKHDSLVELFVRKVKRIRSMPQNRYYWGVCIPCIMEYMGEDIDKDQVHFALKEKFLSNKDPDTGLVIVTSTTELSVEQFRQYIDRILHYFDDMNVRIPTPNMANDFSDNVNL